MYPYFLWSIIQGGINIVLSNYTNTPMKMKTLSNIVFMPIAQFWFLYVLFFIYLLYYSLRKFLSIKTLFLISLFMFFLSPLMNFWVLRLIFFNLVFFISGALMVSKFNIKHFESVCTTKILFATFAIFILSNYFFVGNYKNMKYL